MLKLESRPIPIPQRGQILLKIKAIGLNRSELFTRQGHSPSVRFPRILGIEATGLVAAIGGEGKGDGGVEAKFDGGEVSSGEGELIVGDVVCTAMGEMGRAYDGGYAEFCVVSAGQVKRLVRGGEAELRRLGIGWEVLGAMPEMFQTAYGALFRALRVEKGERVLIRGASSSVGLAAASLARGRGAFVAGTTRDKGRKGLLEAFGVERVIVDTGKIAGEVGEEKFDKILELIGTTTLEDSLLCAREYGVVCMAGIVGNSWTLKEFSPMEAIPVTVALTVYSGSESDVMRTPLEEMVQQIAQGKLEVPLGKTYKLEEMVEAHQCMEENRAGGKVVVLT